MSDTTSERTIAPSGRRLDEARGRGEVARSGDLSAAAGAVGAMVVLAAFAPSLLRELSEMMRAMLAGAMTPEAGIAWPGVWPVIGSLAAILLSLVALAWVANVMQVGLLAAGERVSADWSRVSLSAGLSRMFSTRAAVRGLQAAAKLAVVAVVAFIVIRDRMARIVACCAAGPSRICAEAGSLVLSMGLRIGAALLVLGLIDLLYQRFQRLRDLRMTRREMMDELKNSRGDRAVRLRHESMIAQSTPRHDNG